MAQKLGEALNQSVVVDNRPGGAGGIAAQAVARANPDGYTLLLASGSLCISANLYKKLPFDPARSFAPVSLVGHVPHMLVVSECIARAALERLAGRPALWPLA